jgi:hypothetical protein
VLGTAKVQAVKLLPDSDRNLKDLFDFLRTPLSEKCFSFQLLTKRFLEQCSECLPCQMMNMIIFSKVIVYPYQPCRDEALAIE